MWKKDEYGLVEIEKNDDIADLRTQFNENNEAIRHHLKRFDEILEQLKKKVEEKET